MRMVVVIMMVSSVVALESWKCPQVKNVSCSCDLPRTLRCTGPNSALPKIAQSLRKLNTTQSVSLLDCTLQDYFEINTPILQGVSLLGLVISSGEIKSVVEDAFIGLTSPLLALGLPNNKLSKVPVLAISKLAHLTRLDLSHNEIHELSNEDFKELPTLKLLDLSGNDIRNISEFAFFNSKQLKVLRLKFNNLDVNAIKHLKGLLSLEELDLSNNKIIGPLSSITFPSFPHLQTLNLGHNQITSITEGALEGLGSLKTLILKHNLIDVLEDNAFKSLPSLISLDLAHNRIVAVSEASLAHLLKLKTLDVSNNFLRALTSDLISPLQGLKELKLDDNDISMISADALKTRNLQSLSLTDNPLNCDCGLRDFAKWLKSSNISQLNRISAVCATPPHLENGLVEDLHPEELTCEGYNDFSYEMDDRPLPISRTQLTYRGFSFDGSQISLLWYLSLVGAYNCYALLVYEELGDHEVLLESNRLRCSSKTSEDPHSLVITIEASNLQIGHKYRYSLVMVETNMRNETALLLGRSEIILLQEKTTPQILSLNANLTSAHSMNINANIWYQNDNCAVLIHILSPSKIVHQLQLNCSLPRVTIKDFPEKGPFNICAILPKNEPHCVWVQALPMQFQENIYHTSLTVFFILFSLLMALSVFGYKNRTKHSQPKLPNQNTTEQNARYTKLLATTRL